MSHHRRGLHVRRYLPVVAASLSACDGSTKSSAPETPPPAVIASLTIIDGEGQGVRPGDRLPRPLSVRVRDSHGEVIKDVKISWYVQEGSGHFWSLPDERPIGPPLTTFTDAQGTSSMRFLPTTVGTSLIVVTAAGLEGRSVAFRATAEEPQLPIALVPFGPLFDCGDPSIFLGPQRSSNVRVYVGTVVEWEFDPTVHPICGTARVRSTEVPPGGEPFDSGVMKAGEKFRFIPRVAGTWRFVDAINGGTGTLVAIPE